MRERKRRGREQRAMERVKEAIKEQREVEKEEWKAVDGESKSRCRRIE